MHPSISNLQLRPSNKGYDHDTRRSASNLDPFVLLIRTDAPMPAHLARPQYHFLGQYIP